MSRPLGSETKEYSNQHLCYECGRWHDASIMQPYDCRICKRRKCFNHGGNQDSTCQICKTIEVCSDCMAFGECCKKTPLSLEEENHNLKVEIQLLRYENQRLKQRIETIRVVALQGINDYDTQGRTRQNQ